VLVEILHLGPLATNCYLFSPDGELAIVIDPGAEADIVARHVDALELTPIAIINTHGHLDHIGGNARLKTLLGDVPLLIGAGDELYLGPGAEAIHRQDALLIGPVAAALFQAAYRPSPPADAVLGDGDVAPGGLKVLATPGHTAGGITLVADGAAFVGDTVFAGSVGRWDLCGGDEQTLITAIKTKILALPPNTTLFPGHGDRTTVAVEKERNPFLR